MMNLERPSPEVVILLNGEAPDLAFLRARVQGRRLYVADGGAISCLAAGLSPEKLLGDFDSADPQSFPQDWDWQRIPDQNSSDFQKVLKALPDDVGALTILGGLGLRLDHTLSNLMIACSVDPALPLRFEDEKQCLIRVTPACPLDLDLPAEHTVSLLPLMEAEGVFSEGLVWELSGQRMAIGGQLGQSNRARGRVSLRVESGQLFVWMPALQKSYGE